MSIDIFVIKHLFVIDCIQRQFNIFVINLRETYKGKVATFRQVIDIHRTELQSKESYWNEMLEVSITNWRRENYVITV